MNYNEFLQSETTLVEFIENIQIKLIERDERFVNRTTIHQNLREGAILFLLLYPKELHTKKMKGMEILQNIYTLLVQRSHQMHSNPGDMAFPGGKQDIEDESLIATALREAHEEVGIDPQQVKILGYMDEFLSSSFVVARAIIAELAISVPQNNFRSIVEKMYQPKTQEADATVVVPLSHFFLPGNYTSRQMKMKHRTGTVRFINIDSLLFGAHLWGLTASMIKRLLDIIFENNPLPTD